MIVESARGLGAGIVMEDLKGIKRKRRGRSLNRRLHNFWPARKLQFYVEYKAKLFGLPVQYLNPILGIRRAGARYVGVGWLKPRMGTGS